MAVSQIPVYKPSSNEALLNALRSGLSPQYQSRIPNVTKANIQQTMQTLMDAPELRNEFIDSLINRIGLTIFKSKIWKNPMRTFKIDPLTWGAVIQEVQVGLLEAKVYDPDRDYTDGDIWKRELPPVEVAYHQVNRQNFYKLTINEDMLNRAFINEFGLSQMVTNLMNAMYNSANHDEFVAMCGLFAEYARNGGYFKVNVPNVEADDSGPEQAKALLRKVRAYAGNLAFFSPWYNASKLPTFAAEEDLVLFVSPEVKAAMDVEAFAAAFNIPYTDVPARLITIPKASFGISGVQAILTTKDFFVVADKLIRTESILNPNSLGRNYWFHVHQILSLSLFVPAIMFWTGAGDVIPTDEAVVTGISAITAKYSQDGDIVVDPAPLTRGELYIMEAKATTDPADTERIEGVRWEITGNNKSSTYIHQTGNLQVGGDETANSIVVRATTTWIDPDGVQRDGETITRTFILTGDLLPLWPAVETPTDITVEGVSVTPAFAPNTLAYTVVVPGGTSTADQVVLVGVQPSGYTVAMNGANDVATITLENGTDRVYTVTIN